jgi:hypothetical protein
MNKSHLTAINRTKLSTPMRKLQENGLLIGNVLDYGSGRGNDAKLLGIEQYDPYYHPTYPNENQYDTITCNYVLNVVTGSEQVSILSNLQKLLTTGGKAYVSVRNDLKLPQQKGRGCKQVQVHLTLPIVTQNSNFKMYLLTKTSY